MKTATIHTCRIVLGILFLVSAFAKAWGASDFADIVLMYGDEWLTGFVPVLIAIETLLALLLLLNIKIRNTGVATFVFIIIVSAIFLYGVTMRGVQDCGCFGGIKALQMKPGLVFVRNAILLCFCCPIMVWGNNDSNLSTWRIIVLIGVTSAITGVTGIAMGRTYHLPQININKETASLTIEETGLANYLPAMSKDSVYAVYLFSYNCPFCQDSYANAEQYYTMHVADGAFGLAVADSVARKRFYRLYQPKMPIYEISEEQMSALTSNLPLFLIIRNGKIETQEVGSVTSPGIVLE